ncbi:MAG: hypothetical protein SFX19_06000 [Alphaproteobacteria bacterium]|nr:hypothetical protein [Alphaproteobacteria bacterium]
METPEPLTAAPEKAPEASAATRWLQALTYPVSLISGLWMVNRDVHQSTYINLGAGLDKHFKLGLSDGNKAL